MNPSPSKRLHHYTSLLTTEQAQQLRSLLETQGFLFEQKPHTLFAARKNKLVVLVYEKGPKLLLQGSDIEDFVQFTLEPLILQKASLGYDEQLHPEWFDPHFGIDEAGKGDYFGPLVIAGVYVNPEIARNFLQIGITDSKKIHSDAKIAFLAKKIRNSGAPFSIVKISPKRYNQLYNEFKNLNDLLAWGHARVIENLCQAQPDCPRAVSDKFASEFVLKKRLMQKGKTLELVQKTKAESDPAVAAASILARDTFVQWLASQAKLDGESEPYPKGVSDGVKKRATEIAGRKGPEFLSSIVKIHFKTTQEILAALPKP